jgi:hypothetical protein
MSENESYRHEDIEALLMSKSFGELLAEEKAYVLQHVQDEQEYTTLRGLLLEMHELSFSSELKDPPESLETALLHGFAENAEKVKGYDRRLQPWIGWAIAASVVGFCVVFFFWPSSGDETTASMKESTEPNATEQQVVPSDAPQQQAPKTVVDVPKVILPSEVESLLAQVVQATTPEPPGYADHVYDYEDAIDAVSLTEEEVSEDFTPVEVPQTDATMSGDAASSAAPAAARAESVESLAETETKSTKAVTARPEALGKANRKKSRNPDVLKLSQSKKLKSFLRKD